MKYKVELKVSNTALFDTFIQTVLEDINAFTGEKMNPMDLKKGFSYRKNLSMQEKRPKYAQVTFLDYKYPEYYHIHYHSDKNDYHTILHVESKGKKSVLMYEKRTNMDKESKEEKLSLLKKFYFYCLQRHIQKHVAT